MGDSDQDPCGHDTIVSACVEIVNQRGVHARAAAKFVKLAETFDARVTVIRDSLEVAGMSILGLMMLGAGPGTQLTIRAEGPARREALSALLELVRSRFNEDR